MCKGGENLVLPRNCKQASMAWPAGSEGPEGHRHRDEFCVSMSMSYVILEALE